MTDANERPDKTLIVECPGCGTQFRFDRTLFHAAPGARVRCRRCGRSIEISNPDVQVGQSAQRPPAPPPKAPSATQPDAPPVAQSDASPVARPTDTPARPDARSPAQAAAPTAAPPEVLLSLDVEAQTLAPPEASQPVQSEPPPPARPEAPSPARPKRSSPAAGRTTPGPPVPSSPVPPERGWKRRSDIFRVEEPAGSATEAHGHPKVSLVPYLVAAVTFVFALVASFWYFETGGKGGGAGTKRPAATGAGTPKAAAPKGGGFKFERVESSYHRNPQAGLLFVLTGRVAPVGPSAGNGPIRVRVSVLGAEKQVIAQKTVAAGATIPDDVIARMGREEIDRAIVVVTGARRPVEAATAPDESLPFQAVFFDVAGKVGSYELAAEREH